MLLVDETHSLNERARFAATMREAADRLEGVTGAFKSLQAAIEAEGYEVTLNLHDGTYSLRKRQL